MKKPLDAFSLNSAPRWALQAFEAVQCLIAFPPLNIGG
jgi:hypothetical protein